MNSRTRSRYLAMCPSRDLSLTERDGCFKLTHFSTILATSRASRVSSYRLSATYWSTKQVPVRLPQLLD